MGISLSDLGRTFLSAPEFAVSSAFMALSLSCFRPLLNVFHHFILLDIVIIIIDVCSRNGKMKSIPEPALERQSGFYVLSY